MRDAVPASVTRRIVLFACGAPSVYNTQPWAWRLRPDGFDLYADHNRRLAVADPSGRELVVSCGRPCTTPSSPPGPWGGRRPCGGSPTRRPPRCSPRSAWRPRPPPRSAAADLRCAAGQEHRPAPLHVVADPRRAARTAGRRGHASGTTGAEAITDVTERFRVELLVSRAVQLQDRDPDVAAEQRLWLDRRRGMGVPSATCPTGRRRTTSHRSRFGVGSLEDAGRDVEGTDGLIVLCGERDDPAAWLRAGEGLSALWLHAVRNGLSVVPLSQVVEVDETRSALKHEVLGGRADPLLLLRVGWQAIGRRQLVPTPRRPLEQRPAALTEGPRTSGPRAWPGR